MSQKNNVMVVWYLGAILVGGNIFLHWLFSSVHLGEDTASLVHLSSLLVIFSWLNRRYLHVKPRLGAIVGILEQVYVNSSSWLLICIFILPIMIQIWPTDIIFLMKTILLTVLGVFMEEYLCRGLLLGYALKEKVSYKQLMSRIFQISILFGLAHIGNVFNQSLAFTFYQVFYTMVYGIYFSALTLRTKGLFWSMFLHFFINFNSSLLLQGDVTAGVPSLLGILIVNGILLICSLYLLRKKKVGEWLIN
ncbi:CPBP family intramembrane glutamic endopeptidase [Streptococcus ovis]|uniref:CPBP family intramembrane glutamic endopeptidase n=1 Tax=Streptococcus ovis TaxID=82806 RepID=UPI000382C61F|nr:CPBP family intramembrane glutamic endopeptidase [Streptococcus ovis]